MKMKEILKSLSKSQQIELFVKNPVDKEQIRSR